MRRQRSSVEDAESQALEKSNRVMGLFVPLTAGGAWVDRSCSAGGTGLFAFEGEKTVLSPEARKIPPPTRLGFDASRACLASLKGFDAGVDVEEASAEGDRGAADGVEGDFIVREDTGFRSSDSGIGIGAGKVPVEVEAVGRPFCDVDGCFEPEVTEGWVGDSTISMGIRRRFAEPGEGKVACWIGFF